MESYADNRLELKGKHTKDDFLKFYKKCKDFRLRERYLALSLGFKYSWNEVADNLGLNYQTVLEWVKAYNEDGLDGLIRGKPSGRPPSLTEEQEKQVRETVQQSPRTLGFRFSNWTVGRMTGWIADKFRVVLCPERIRQILHEIGFSYIKPVYSYIMASKKERKDFLEEFDDITSSDDVIVFEDESTVRQHPTLHGMWVLKGTKAKVKTFGNHAKRHVFAAVNPATGKKTTMVTKRLTSKAFLDFLERLTVSMKGEFTLILDSSPCHKAKRVMEFFETHKDRIRIIWLPKYSPDMNPVEHVWKDMKFNVSHNHMFGTVNKLAWGIRGYFRQLSPEKVKSLCSTDYLFGRL